MDSKLPVPITYAKTMLFYFSGPVGTLSVRPHCQK